MTFGLQRKKPDQFVWPLDCVRSSLKGIKKHFVGWKCRNTSYIQKSDQCQHFILAAFWCLLWVAAPKYLIKQWNSFTKIVNFSMHSLTDGRGDKEICSVLVHFLIFYFEWITELARERGRTRERGGERKRTTQNFFPASQTFCWWGSRLHTTKSETEP